MNLNQTPDSSLLTLDVNLRLNRLNLISISSA